MSTQQQPLCVGFHCRAFGWHSPECVDGDCRGCLPRLAADGLRLCGVHRDRIAEDAIAAAVLYDELALVLAASDRPGERTSGTPEHGTAVSERVMDARNSIRSILVGWCRLVSEERGISLPADFVGAMARYVAKHADWLAAHPAAADVSAELHELARGEPWRLAYPTGARVFVVTDCPEGKDDQRCTGQIRAIMRRTDSLLPSELACDVDEDHRWSASQWRRVFGRASEEV